MQESLIEALTSRNDKYACALSDRIVSESRVSDKWYEYFDDFASLLCHSKSLVRNRAINILAANARWDKSGRFDEIISEFLLHITDDKPITARQCIKALVEIGAAKAEYVPLILKALKSASLSKYKDTMRPLIEKDIEATVSALTNK